MDGVLFRHESQTEKAQCVVIKIDFGEDYDKVDCSFLFSCIDLSGF